MSKNQSDIEIFNNDIKFIKTTNNDDELTINLFFIFEKDTTNQNNIYKANLANEVANSLKNMFLSEMRKISILKELDILNYDPLNPPDDKNYLWKIDSKELKEFKTYIDNINANACSLYNNEENYNELKSLIIKIESKDASCTYIIKRIFKSKNISKSNSFYLTSGIFKKIDEKVISIDEKFEGFIVNNSVYITNATNFETVTSYFKERLSAAQQEYDNILKKGFFETSGIEKDNILENSHIINKINTIAIERIYESLDFDILKEHNNKSNCGLKLNDQNNKFLLSSTNDFKVFLKLINDDFLESSLSKYQYEARNKSRSNK